MSHCFLHIANLSFSYDQAPDPLFDSVSFQISRGWTGVVGPNGCGKTTLLKLLTNRLIPESGTITASGAAYYCEQRTDSIPEQFPRLLDSSESAAYRIRNALAVGEDWLSRWESLSHGERKRCQIATALFLNPAVLAIDEPTNHLDIDARTTVYKALESFDGVGLLVSHDRMLLDTLCTHILFIDPPCIDVRKGGYSTAHNERIRENNLLLHRRENLKKQITRLNRELTSRRQRAQSSDKRRSKRTVGRKDHDAKAKKDLARITGKDAVDGILYKRLKSRIEKLDTHRRSILHKPSSPTGIDIGDRRIKGVFPLIVPSGVIQIGGSSRLFFPDLSISENDRIGAVGANGTGKSTFIRYLVASPGIPGNRILYIPQEIPVADSQRIIYSVRHLAANERGEIMTIISRLGSDPERLLASTTPSPGEVRKMMIADGIRRNPSLIVMDEPTNHMDLPSVECLEQALEESSCPLVLVSHDRVFLDNLATHYWLFTRENEADCRIGEKTVLSRDDI